MEEDKKELWRKKTMQWVPGIQLTAVDICQIPPRRALISQLPRTLELVSLCSINNIDQMKRSYVCSANFVNYVLILPTVENFQLTSLFLHWLFLEKPVVACRGNLIMRITLGSTVP